MVECAKCKAVCQPAICTTSCPTPLASCEPVCEEPDCEWNCHKPTNCPSPTCDLVCENPICPPSVECCACALGGAQLLAPFPFFTDLEPNKECCSCPQ
jgi:hypothetical protein